jgi:hybrid cluster-associated redox disulfide protein
MRPEQLPHAAMLIDDVMRTWPRTIRVLMRRRMLCIGCPIGVFHTVADACKAHEIDEEDLLGELAAAIGAGDEITFAGGSRPPASARADPSPSLSDARR